MSHDNGFGNVLPYQVLVLPSLQLVDRQRREGPCCHRSSSIEEHVLYSLHQCGPLSEIADVLRRKQCIQSHDVDLDLFGGINYYYILGKPADRHMHCTGQIKTKMVAGPFYAPHLIRNILRSTAHTGYDGFTYEDGSRLPMDCSVPNVD